MTTFIDTNVLIYITKPDSEQHAIAVEAFNKCKLDGAIILTDVAYAEFSIGMPDQRSVDEIVAAFALVRAHMNDEALFEAGRVFMKHKQNGGGRTKPLPDHFIGAHAKIEGATLLTNNSKDYETIEGLKVVGLTN